MKEITMGDVRDGSIKFLKYIQGNGGIEAIVDRLASEEMVSKPVDIQFLNGEIGILLMLLTSQGMRFLRSGNDGADMAHDMAILFYMSGKLTKAACPDYDDTTVPTKAG